MASLFILPDAGNYRITFKVNSYIHVVPLSLQLELDNNPLIHTITNVSEFSQNSAFKAVFNGDCIITTTSPQQKLALIISETTYPVPSIINIFNDLEITFGENYFAPYVPSITIFKL